MKIYTFYNSDLSDNILFSFNENDILEQVTNEYNNLCSTNDFYLNLDEYLDLIKEEEIILPECSWIICDWNEWEAEYKMDKYLQSTNQFETINFASYENPEFHMIDENGYIDNEPFIFLQ